RARPPAVAPCAGMSAAAPSGGSVDRDGVADVRRRPRRHRALAPDAQRRIIVGERPDRLGAAVAQLAEAGVAVLAADHPILPVAHLVLLGQAAAASSGAAALNCAASVEPAIAVVLLAPPESATAPAPK